MTSLATSPVGIEALDDPAADPALVVRMLHDIARANRWFGGRATLHAGLRWLTSDADRATPLSLFDVGTGAGDLPLAAVRWGAIRGITVRPLGLERIPAAASLAHNAGVPTVLGCAGALPLADRSVDIVLLSQLAHHLDDDTVVRCFADCSRVARRGVIVAELRPSRWAKIAFRVGGRVLRMHDTTISDGITSIRRGFTPARLAALAFRAHAGPVHMATLPFARVLACWRTDQ